MDQQTVLQAVQSWPADKQIEFISRVWDDLADSGWQPELTEELKAELDRRLDAYEADPTNVLTWEQVVEKIKGGR